jgi:hypothetical protein
MTSININVGWTCLTMYVKYNVTCLGSLKWAFKNIL